MEKRGRKDEVMEAIYTAIMNGTYRYGAQIKEAQIAEELSMSRAPVREALAELVSDGILEQRPRRGVFVKEITAKDIYDTYETKGILEGFLATGFILQAEQEDYAQLQRYVDAMSRAGNSREEVVRIGEQFHALTLKYGRNSVLKRALERVNRKSQILFYQNWIRMYTLDEITERHQKIVDALISRKRHTIEATIREHYIETGTKIVLISEEI